MAKRNKSALKRARQNEQRRLRNRHYRTMVKNAVKKVFEAAQAGDFERARSFYPEVMSIINKAVSKGVLHWRTASRKISRLSRLVNSLQRAQA